MFNKLKRLIHILKEYEDLDNNLRIMKMQILFNVEEYIKKQDTKRRDEMQVNELAKEVLFMDEEYYIISAEDLKKYITRNAQK